MRWSIKGIVSSWTVLSSQTWERYWKQLWIIFIRNENSINKYEFLLHFHKVIVAKSHRIKVSRSDMLKSEPCTERFVPWQLTLSHFFCWFYSSYCLFSAVLGRNMRTKLHQISLAKLYNKHQFWRMTYDKETLLREPLALTVQVIVMKTFLETSRKFSITLCNGDEWREDNSRFLPFLPRTQRETFLSW